MSMTFKKKENGVASLVILDMFMYRVWILHNAQISLE